MTSASMHATAARLADFCRSDDTERGLSELYHPDAVSVEAMARPGGSRETRGLDGIRGKHAWWGSTFQVHSASVDGPFPHGDDRFALIFDIDASNRETGERRAMREIGVYTVDGDGRIVREEFFYRV